MLDILFLSANIGVMQTTKATNVEKQFYVYIHSKPNGVPFYVGKGNGYRGRRFNRPHNVHYQRVVRKYGSSNINVEIVTCTSEQAAFELEVKTIKALRDAGVRLCNVTAGGEGPSGYVFSTEARAKMVAAQARRTPEAERARRDKITASNLATARKRSPAEDAAYVAKHVAGSKAWWAAKRAAATTETHLQQPSAF